MNVRNQPESAQSVEGLYDNLLACLLSSMTIFGFSELDQSSFPNTRMELIRQVQKDGRETLLGSKYLGYIQQLEEKTQHDHTVVLFVDTESTDEVVYAIEVDHTRKCVRLTFRGSITVSDWLHDLNFRMAFCDNPVPRTPTSTRTMIRQADTIGVHAGFRKYLFSPIKGVFDDRQESSSRVAECFMPHHKQGCYSKYEIIRDKMEMASLRYPDYQLVVTGHSLGGALATLMSFCLACDLPRRVTCLSFAAPRIGNGDFVRAFQQLELTGRLRNIRVANVDDVVTALPDTSFTLGLVKHLLRSHFFLHAGVCLRLNYNKPPVMLYPKIQFRRHHLDDWKHRSKNLGRRLSTVKRVVFGPDRIPKNHSCQEYLERLTRDNVVERTLEPTMDRVYECYIPMRYSS